MFVFGWFFKGVVFALGGDRVTVFHITEMMYVIFSHSIFIVRLSKAKKKKKKKDDNNNKIK